MVAGAHSLWGQGCGWHSGCPVNGVVQQSLEISNGKTVRMAERRVKDATAIGALVRPRNRLMFVTAGDASHHEWSGGGWQWCVLVKRTEDAKRLRRNTG